MKAQFVFSVLATSIFFAGSSPLIADSKKELFSGNGHYYQKFDSLPKLWNEAKSACQKLGGHLVTVTSKSENDFLMSPVIQAQIGEWNWFGGSNQSGQWQWVTGEPFSFNNFRSGESTSPFLEGLHGDGSWSSRSDGALPYICEWEPKTYTGVLSLPDLNGNGSPETAALYFDTKTFDHKVVIKDINTEATIKTITFDTKNITPPIAMSQVSDMDGNGVPEIAVMYWTKKSGAIGPMVGIMIKDASTGNSSRNTPVSILSNQYKAIGLTNTSDITGDGINELEVLVMKYSNSTTSIQIIDPVSGAVIKTVNF